MCCEARLSIVRVLSGGTSGQKAASPWRANTVEIRTSALVARICGQQKHQTPEEVAGGTASQGEGPSD